MATKFIITIKGNLSTKYAAQFGAVETSLNQLITSDGQKGISTSLIYLDDPATAAQYNFPLLSVPSEKGCKDIVDSLYRSQSPDYIVLFGSGDVIPFQTLQNPLFNQQNDSDPNVPSDLPYACDAPYNTDATVFTSPSRVVGRIPDIPGVADANYVNSLIQDIVNFTPGSSAQYSGYFGVTAATWQGASQQTMQQVFGNSFNLLISPPAAGGYSSLTFSPVSHYYNCHGALGTTDFYGDDGSSNPVCLSASDLNGNINAGTIVAAECCYGAQLLNSNNPGLSIAGNYLKNHAIGFMGSSTIAYGVSTGQDQADLICQYFLKNILNGASAGRALLQARQTFLINSGATPNPYSFKTMAQFYLLGDPSVQPVAVPQSKNLFSTLAGRRAELQSKGLNLGVTVARPNKISETSTRHLLPEIAAVMKQLRLGHFDREQVFEAENSIADAIFASKALISPKVINQKIRFHVYQNETKKLEHIRKITALVVKESEGKVLEWRVYNSH